jgi:hypothetical protein
LTVTLHRGNIVTFSWGINCFYCSLYIYIYDLPPRINSVSEPILFVDDTSVIISNRNFEDFFSVSNLVLSHMIKWFAANNLVLNLDKVNVMKFIKKNSAHSAVHISYKEK